jgi:hypothetical protein
MYVQAAGGGNQVKKIGTLLLKFEKHEYKKRLEYEIRTSEDALIFAKSRKFPKGMLDDLNGHTKGLKMALRLLNEMDSRDDDEDDE